MDAEGAKAAGGEEAEGVRYKVVVELCAGTAAFSWGLVGAKFPVSRMGNKAGYVEGIYGSLGIRPFVDVPDACLWIEHRIFDKIVC